MRRDITFQSEGLTLKGWLYLPDDLAGGAQVPGIVTANAVTAIKEITLPGYAERFAQAGFASLVFDYAHWGESEGEPRNHFVAYTQQQNVRDAITWLANQPEVDGERIGGWGISMGGSHMFHVGTFDRRLKAVVVTAASVNAISIYEQFMGREGLQGFLAQIVQERQQRFVTGEPAFYMPAWGKMGEMVALPQEEAYNFYMEAKATVAPTYDNRITAQSVQNMAEYNPDFAVHLLSPTPLLIVHAEHDVIPVGLMRAVYDRAREPKKMIVLDCLHSDLYNKEPWFSQSADAAIEWFRNYLSRV